MKLTRNNIDIDELCYRLEEASDYWLDGDLKDNYNEVKENDSLNIEDDGYGLSIITAKIIIELLLEEKE